MRIVLSVFDRSTAGDTKLYASVVFILRRCCKIVNSRTGYRDIALPKTRSDSWNKRTGKCCKKEHPRTKSLAIAFFVRITSFIIFH